MEAEPKNLALDIEQYKTLFGITQYLNSSLDLDAVLNYVIDQVVAVTGAERGFLMLYDEGNLHFQVARGMDRQDLDTPEFEVSNTILREVLTTGQPLLTFNAQYDNRLEAASIVKKGLRSILCVPIKVHNKLIGLVYLDNRLKAGMFQETHRDLLAAFASEAAFAIDNARLYRVAIEKGRLQSELEMARNIQRGLLPQTFDPIAGYEVAFDWHSAREVAGDFYDCLILNDHSMGIVVADVSDKGAAAAIFMAVARSLFRGNAVSADSPMDAVQQTNRLILQDSTGGMFVTLYYTTFDSDGSICGVNAGHNLPLLYHARDGAIEFLPKGGHPLGWFETIPLQQRKYHLSLGDVLILYTDGLTEATNLRGEEFGEHRLVEAIKLYADQNAEIIKQGILESVANFVGNAPPFDDLTLVVVRYIGT